jgi:hypothetical protein
MSQHYEWTTADALPIEVVGPGTELGESDTESHALVLGDPYASAFVIEGTPEELGELARTILSAVESLGGTNTSDATSILRDLRSDVTSSSTMESEDRDYVAERIDDALAVLSKDLARLAEVAKTRMADPDGEVARLAAFALGHLEPFGPPVDGVVDTDGRLRCSACGNDEFGYIEGCQDYRVPRGQDPEAKTVAVYWSADGTADSGDSIPGLFCDHYRGGGCARPVRLPDDWDIEWI